MDANATTPVLPEVLEAMRPYYGEQFGNASSIHWFGQHARAAVERAREQVAALLNCRAAEIVFTSGGTEGDNLALFGTLKPGEHVVTSTIEHEAVLKACEALERRGCEVTYVAADARGVVGPNAVREALRANTRLVSVMLANNETGVLQPVKEIAAIAHEAGALFHTDAVQAAGKITVDVKEIGCDLMTISGHKMHAPQGSGAVFVRKGTLLGAMLVGGNHERQRRAGTENLPAIVGLGCAVEIADAGLRDGTMQRIGRWRDKLEAGLLAQIDDAVVNGAGAPRVPNTTNLQLRHVEGEALIIALDLKGLAVSTGAACSSGAVEPSHVLTAMGLTPEQARASIRFSLGKHNAEADIDLALELVPQAVKRLRELSPARTA
jgi:cysteine desulfurase